MKLICTSDTHGKFAKLRYVPGDVLVLAGDILPNISMHKHTDARLQLMYLEDTFAPFLIAAGRLYKHIVLVPGNHDRCFEAWPKECRAVIDKTPAKLLIDEAVTIEGRKFYGSPWTPWFFGEHWSFNFPRSENDLARKHMQDTWAKIPDDTDVLVTHGPPYGIRDLAPGNRRVGCPFLTEAIIDRVKPTVHVFGHIHQQHGTTFIDSTRYVNVAALNDKYELVNQPVEIEI